jgi:hypothetical protein
LIEAIANFTALLDAAERRPVERERFAAMLTRESRHHRVGK